MNAKLEIAGSPETASPDVTALIAAALRGKTVAVEPRLADSLLETVAAHGVGPLLHHVLESGGAIDAWPDEITAPLKETARLEAAREALRVKETRHVLAAFHAEGVVPLVLNGTALAYACYPRPYLRPREHTDLLVSQGNVVNAVRALGEIGYRRHDRLPGRRVLGQDTYLRQDESGFTRHIDLHWVAGNRFAADDHLDYRELRGHAVTIEALSPCALGPCHEDALLHACLRRHVPGDGDDTLIELYDLHLLVNALTPVEFVRLCQRALDMRLGGAVRGTIEQLQANFHTALPDGTLDDHFPAELLADPRALGSGREAIAWATEHIIPSPAYMRPYFGGTALVWLPALYLRRGLNAVRSLLRRSR